jgi:adenine-specific DNA-methyltransferase
VSRLNDLLRELRTREPALAGDLEREVAALADRRAFGLNFERHVPEAVDLPGRRVRKGDKVRILTTRGQTPKRSDEKLWRVVGIDRSARTAKLESVAAPVADSREPIVDARAADHETKTATLDDLVVVAEFRDPIYPGLVSTGKVERGADKPFHTVINAENFHALQTLLFTHRGRIDCIYIDPPYNTGAKDWKYNNDYVESDDLYRHSKWLAFMERRLLLAKELLNPEDSVLIVTIDEKEVHRLGLLVAQVFEGLRTQMITTVTNQRGVARGQEFARVEEYMFAVFVGEAQVSQGPDDLLTSEETRASQRIDVWNRLMRRGTHSQRQDRPRLFYPIFVDPQRKAIVDVGDSLPLERPRSSVTDRPGLDTVWPIRTNGSEGNWTVGPETLRKYVVQGYAKVGARSRSGESWSISYLISKDIKRVENGEIRVVGRDPNGVPLLELDADVNRSKLPRTVWNRDAHNSGTYGSELLGRFIPGRKFPFPKSLFLVEDTLRIFLRTKTAATVLDFFSGSGTTAHAVVRLNKQDGGRRTSISVTNNEVAADEQRALREKKLRPGDPEWERWGICDYITKPRIEAAITGQTPDGKPIKGDYQFTDEFPMANGFEENVEFFTLTYEATLRVASHREFLKIAPLLWIRAGARGRRIDDISAGWDVADTYGVLANLDHTQHFLSAVAANNAVAIAYIVTDEERLFEWVAQQLPGPVEPVRLYEAYLRNFEIESGRGLL